MARIVDCQPHMETPPHQNMISFNDDVTDLTVILCQDVKLVPVNVQDSCREVRVGGELTLELIQSPAVEQVAAAALEIVKTRDHIVLKIVDNWT